MSKAEIRENILSEIFPDHSVNHKKSEFITWCNNPQGCNGKHHKMKLQINFEVNVFHCWVCGWSGFISRLFKVCATERQKKQYFDTIEDFSFHSDSQEKILEWPEYTYFLLDELYRPETMDAYRWLTEKTGLSDEQIYQHKISFCVEGDYRNRIIFPSFSEQGHLNFFITRDISRTDRFKYLNCEGVRTRDIIFNEILIDWNKPIILVEGVKSYYKHLMLQNIVPIFGTSFGFEHLLFKKSILNDVPQVFVALDDEAKSKSIDVMRFYNSCDIDVRLVHLEDVNQPDEIETEDFFERILSAQRYSVKQGLLEKINHLRRVI